MAAFPFDGQGNTQACFQLNAIFRFWNSYRCRIVSNYRDYGPVNSDELGMRKLESVDGSNSKMVCWGLWWRYESWIGSDQSSADMKIYLGHELGKYRTLDKRSDTHVRRTLLLMMKRGFWQKFGSQAFNLMKDATRGYWDFLQGFRDRSSIRWRPMMPERICFLCSK